MAIKIVGNRTEDVPVSNIITPPPANYIHLQKISFCEDKEDYKPEDEKILLIQFLGMTQQGPIILSRIYKGTMEIDEEDIKNKLEKMKSRIITTNKNNEVLQDLDNLNDILTEDYEYIVEPVYCNFNFA